MNAISTALQEAGVQLPSIYERIWRYFKDHPRSTALSCSQVIKLNRTSASSYISEMETRRMLRSEPLDMKLKGPHGAFMNRRVKHYYVNTTEFEMLPKPKRLKPLRTPKPPRKPRVKVEAEVKAPAAAPTLPAEWDAEAVVRALTPRQARAVYDQLKEIFA